MQTYIETIRIDRRLTQPRFNTRDGDNFRKEIVLYGVSKKCHNPLKTDLRATSTRFFKISLIVLGNLFKIAYLCCTNRS